jgi:3-hydroxyacyl-[acyl-carrier-protein] dehydratase
MTRVDSVQLDLEQIKGILPHRAPFLLLSGIDAVEYGHTAKGFWQLTGQEEFFKGHFPGNPVLPGVLMVESLSQAGAVTVLGMEQNQGKTAYFAALDGVKFRRKVYPGERLDLVVEINSLKRGFGKGKGIATVDGQVACEATLVFAIDD